MINSNVLIKYNKCPYRELNKHNANVGATNSKQQKISIHHAVKRQRKICPEFCEAKII